MAPSVKRVAWFCGLAVLALAAIHWSNSKSFGTDERQVEISVKESVNAKQHATSLKAATKSEYSPVVIAELKKELGDKVALSEKFEVTEEVSSLLKITSDEAAKIRAVTKIAQEEIFRGSRSRLRVDQSVVQNEYTDSFTFDPLPIDQSERIQVDFSNALQEIIGKERGGLLLGVIFKNANSNCTLMGFGKLKVRIRINRPPSSLPYDIYVSLHEPLHGFLVGSDAWKGRKLTAPWSFLFEEKIEDEHK